MTGLDTNVVVRYLVADDPRQASRVHAAFEDAINRGESLYLPAIVLAEVLWVLESLYGFEPGPLADTVRAVLEVRQFEVEAKDRVHEALRDFMAGRGDFTDCLIGRQALAAGCDRTLTFDRGLKNNPAFSLL